MVNTATVFAQPAADGSPVVTDTAIAEVRVIAPQVEVTKAVSRDTVLEPCGPAPACGPVLGPDVPSPRPVTYTFEVTNPGAVPLDLSDGAATPEERRDEARVVDTLNPGHPTLEQPGCSPAYLEGDADDDGFVDPDEAWSFTCTQLPVKAQAPNGFNVDDEVVVTANGVLTVGGDTIRSTSVAADDSRSVQVITPDLTLTKTPSATLVRPGTAVTYTYTVTNTGDGGLQTPGPVDDRCTDVTFVSSDLPLDNAYLEPGETWTYTCTQVLEQPEDDPATPTVERSIVNVANVDALDALGNLYVRQATAEVRVFDPDITLDKTASTNWVTAGTEVGYTFVVTNSGDDVTLDELRGILLSDRADPPRDSCTTPTLTDGGDGDALLAVGEAWTFECAATIQQPTTNVAETRGTDIAGGFVSDTDAAFVDVYEPGIAITKTADPTVLPAGGGLVTYSYAVVNTGNVPLAEVATRIVDDRCGPVQYVAGDDDGNGLLTGERDLFETGPPEVWTFTCTARLAADTTNVVTVDGTPVRPDPVGPEPHGPDVGATADALVTVIDAGVPSTTGPTTSTTTSIASTTTLPGVMPATGGDPSRAGVLAVLALVAGAALVIVARRRHGTLG